ncbi:hypothetical protein [Agaribacter marinus]|uniref:Uncharacterized protein n=1 Tax=Agaribacter marinus TaxID=1431249 RepID=A0AA37WI83_9ALTE|nr:hypothetical protein [Agaribacter marinus]GLR71971.1 hypothetical protein GCM10007852_28790 [Agaribacter marinus]
MINNSKFSLILLLTLLAALIGVSSCSQLKRPPVPPIIPHYVISNVNVIDVINERVDAAQYVEVIDGKITNISAIPINAEGLEHIDGSGKYLLPGLWDNHSTLLKFSPSLDYPLYVANGVTSIRSNLSCPNEEKASLYACMHVCKTKHLGNRK